MGRHEELQADSLEAELTDEDRAFLDRFADGVVKRRLTAPVIFFLESMKPLGFVASQALHFFRPIVNIVVKSPDGYDRFAKLLERRGSVELLLRRLEARA
jgi:hypothetical protein